MNETTRFVGIAQTSDRTARFIGVARPAPRRRSAAHRRLEVLAWIAIVGVLAATAVVTGRAGALGGAPAQLTARFQAEPGASAGTGDGGADTSCVVNNCARPPLIGVPTRLRVAPLGIDSPLEDLALDAAGQLQAPRSYDRAGWFADGVLPGEPGPAVIAGHVDSAAGPAVFYRLSDLAPGDTVQVLRGDTWVTFRVTGTEQYPKDQFPSERVYRPTPDAELRLITCGGNFDPGRLSYRDNLVVYAVIV